MSQITITVTSTYRKASATLRPSIRTSAAGKQYLHISRRAFRAAEGRCSYSGTDGVNMGTIAKVPGFGAWAETIEGDLRAWAL